MAWHGPFRGWASLIVALRVWDAWPFSFIWKIIQNPFWRVVMQWHLSTNLLVPYPLFCNGLIHLTFVVIVFWTEPCFPVTRPKNLEVVRQPCQTWTNVGRTVGSNELGSSEENLIKGWFSILQLVTCPKNSTSIVVIVIGDHAKRNMTPPTLPAMSSNGRKALWFGTQSDSKAQGHKALNPWLLKPEIKSTYNTTFFGRCIYLCWSYIYITSKDSTIYQILTTPKKRPIFFTSTK